MIDSELEQLQLKYDSKLSELELIRRLCKPNKVICQELSISLAALKSRMTRLLVKYCVANRTSLVIMALKSGMLRAEDFPDG